VKSYAICEVKSLNDDGDPNGSFEAILSAPTLDRDGEVVDARAFEPLPEHISIDVDHGMTVATTVASGAPFYDGDVLKIKGTYSSIPRAQELRTLVREGHIRKMSVTFMGAERDEKDGVPHVTKAELLNAAFVPIPSNREAAVLVAKAFAPTEDELKAGARNSTKDAERLQGIHDYAVENGALCGDKSHTPQTPEPAAASAGTDPETAVAPASAKSPVTGSAYLAAAKAQAEAASVL
jgi:HK97 family phage prohead protease